MKTHLLIFISVILFFAGVNAQNKACDKVFNKYAGKEGFLTVNIPDSFFYLFFKKESNSNFKLKSFKILSVENKTLNSNVNFYNEIVPKIDRDDYHELMSVKEKDGDFIMLCKQDGDKITEFILISGGKDNVLINFVGRIQLSDMYKITQAVSDNNEIKEIEFESLDK